MNNPPRHHPASRAPPNEDPASPGTRHGSDTAPGARSAFKTLRVTKTLWPPQAGTLRHSATHADQLVCVRYRRDASGLVRYTTIELLIDTAPVKSRRAREQVFDVCIAYREQALRAQVKKIGAKWVAERGMWELTGGALQQLNLTHRARPRPKE